MHEIKVNKNVKRKKFQVCTFFLDRNRIGNRMMTCKTDIYPLSTYILYNDSGTCTGQRRCTRPQPMVTCSCSTSCWTTTAPRRSPISTCGSRSMLPPAGDISKPWRSSLRKPIEMIYS